MIIILEIDTTTLRSKLWYFSTTGQQGYVQLLFTTVVSARARSSS